jgi:phage terminase large subunit-like protein
LEGHLLEEAEGALWTAAMVEAARAEEAPPALDRVVVAVDPAVTTGGDATGIVVVGVEERGESPATWRAWVLEDLSLRGASPDTWARAVLDARDRHRACRIVAEVNQGGDLVTSTLRSVDPMAAVTEVRATRSKSARAEPVAALYEQGRVRHLRGLGELEDQLARMTRTGWTGRGSPDRLDALVWALQAEMIDRAALHRAPRLRRL